jgi:23S rRNA (uracil1939-C5)-methyltransferase
MARRRRRPDENAWKPYGMQVAFDVDGLDARGAGTGTLDGFRYAVEGALPGERVTARIFGRDHGVRLAELLSVERASSHRLEPRCDVFSQCGGCAWQNLAYPQQTAQLENWVRGLFRDCGLQTPADAWQPIMMADETWHYRGKIELSFAGEAGNVTLGFNRRRRFNSIVDVVDCAIGPRVNARVSATVRDWANRHGLEPYDQRRHAGVLRYLVIRETSAGEWLAALVTSRPAVPLPLADLASALEGGSLVWVISDSFSGAVKVDEAHVLGGSGRLVESLDGLEFELSFESFFQSNAAMASRLVALVRQRAALRGREHALDLYSGVGTLSLALARDARRVTGVEFVAAATADAIRNASRNGIENVDFYTGAAEKYRWEDLSDRVDLLVLDPPRSGLHPRLLRRLREHPVERVIYVSCNAAHLAPELAQVNDIYALNYVQCVDLFPHTPHVEVVVELQKRSERSPA